MHLFFMLIHADSTCSYSLAEHQQLRACLESAPGIKMVKEIKRRPGGGYCITAEGTECELEPLDSYLEACGYRWVI